MNAGRVYDRHPQAAPAWARDQPPPHISRRRSGQAEGPWQSSAPLSPHPRPGDYAVLIPLTPSPCASEICVPEDAAFTTISEACVTALHRHRLAAKE